jgi:hypothetical protein
MLTRNDYSHALTTIKARAQQANAYALSAEYRLGFEQLQNAFNDTVRLLEQICEEVVRLNQENRQQ